MVVSSCLGGMYYGAMVGDSVGVWSCVFTPVSPRSFSFGRFRVSHFVVLCTWKEIHRFTSTHYESLSSTKGWIVVRTRARWAGRSSGVLCTWGVGCSGQSKEIPGLIVRFKAMEEEGLSIDLVTKQHLLKAGLSPPEADVFYDQLRVILFETLQSKPRTWQRISQELLQPEQPFPLHQLMYYSTYRDWDTTTLGPPLGWIPTP